MKAFVKTKLESTKDFESPHILPRNCFFRKFKKVIGSVDFVGSGLESFQTFYADIVILIVLITLSLLNFNFC